MLLSWILNLGLTHMGPKQMKLNGKDQFKEVLKLQVLLLVLEFLD